MRWIIVFAMICQAYGNGRSKRLPMDESQWQAKDSAMRALEEVEASIFGGPSISDETVTLGWILDIILTPVKNSLERNQHLNSVTSNIIEKAWVDSEHDTNVGYRHFLIDMDSYLMGEPEESQERQATMEDMVHTLQVILDQAKQTRKSGVIDKVKDVFNQLWSAAIEDRKEKPKRTSRRRRRLLSSLIVD